MSQVDRGRHSRLLRRLEVVAHSTTSLAFALTIILVTTGLATELNAVADTLFGTVGWTVTGVVAITVLCGAFWFYEQHLEEYPRLVLSAGALLAVAGLADLGVNLWVLSRAGLPETVYWEAYGPAIAIVMIAGMLAISRRSVTPVVAGQLRQPHPKVRAVAIALLLATSFVATPFMGGIPVADRDTDGTVSAATAEVIDDFEHNNISLYSNNAGWEINQGSSYEGDYGLYYNNPGTQDYIERGKGLGSPDSISFYMRVDSLSGDKNGFYANAAGTGTLSLDVHSDGVVYVGPYNSESSTGISVPSGTWVKYQIHSITWGSGGTLKVINAETDEVLGETSVSFDADDADNFYRFWGESENRFDYLAVNGAQPTHPLSGTVTDSDGDPVENATVYSVGYDAANPPTIDGTPFDEIAANPLPDGWSQQTAQEWHTDGEIDTDGTELDGTRVLMHTRDQWNLQGHVEIGGRQFIAQADLSPPKASASTDDDLVLSCWDTQPSARGSLFEDNVGASLPGATAEDCDGIVVEKVDPLGDVEQRTTFTPKTEIVTGIKTFDATSTTYEAAFPSLERGIYRVYPEYNQANAMYYSVSPTGDVATLEADIENWASDRSDAISQYNEEVKKEYDAGNLEVVSTSTNSTGHYSLDVPNQATEAEIRVVRDGGKNPADPGNLTRADLRSEIDSTVRNNFNDATAVSFGDADEETFVSVCERMDPIAEDVGVPFYGERKTDVPNQNADIEGTYILPNDLDPRVQQCAAISLTSSLLNDVGDFLDPGLADNLADLSDAELEKLLSQVQSMIRANDQLCQEYADQVGADTCEDALKDPSQMTRGELENRVSDGYDTVDDGSNHMGGGSGGIIGGGGGVDVGDGDTNVGDSTFSTTWDVDGVDNWNDAELMIRLTWSDGTTTVLNQSDENVTVEESIIGPDTVKLEDHPIGDTDPAAVTARLDVVTQDAKGAGESDAVKNPTWDGELPRLNAVKVSKWYPGSDDSFTVSVDPEDPSRFGDLQRVDVTGPDGSTTTYQPEGGEVTAQTSGVGNHRVAVVFSAVDSNNTEFTETVQVRADHTSRDRAPSIRAQSGSVGRYAVVGHGLETGEVESEYGAGNLKLTAVLPQSADVPDTMKADTTGLSLASDSTTEVRLVRGSNRETVRKHVGLILQAPKVNEDALVWRNNDALTRDGSPYGKVVVEDHTTVDTFTTDRASADIRVNADPSVIDRVRHWIDANFSMPSL